MTTTPHLGHKNLVPFSPNMIGVLHEVQIGNATSSIEDISSV